MNLNPIQPILLLIRLTHPLLPPYPYTFLPLANLVWLIKIWIILILLLFMILDLLIFCVLIDSVHIDLLHHSLSMSIIVLVLHLLYHQLHFRIYIVHRSTLVLSILHYHTIVMVINHISLLYNWLLFYLLTFLLNHS